MVRNQQETWEAMKDQGTARLVIPSHSIWPSTKILSLASLTVMRKLGQTGIQYVRRDNCFACPINCKRVSRCTMSTQFEYESDLLVP